MCDYLELKKQTKYLAKKSLDNYVLKFPNSNQYEIYLAAINFLLMSIKFNEDPILYEKLTIQWYLSQFNPEFNPYNAHDFILFQLDMYNQPEFSLNFTTPYDFLGLYAQSFFINNKMIQKINHILDFSYTIPELIFCSAEQLFFGAMLMAFKDKIEQKRWILGQTFYRQNVQKISKIIENEYNRQIEGAINQMAEQ